MSLQNFWRIPVAAALLALLAACAHPIGISPLETPVRNETGLNPKKVAYVMTDADLGKEVITAGGGGDKVSYFPTATWKSPFATRCARCTPMCSWSSRRATVRPSPLSV